MSQSSPRAEAAAQTQFTTAQLQKQLTDIAFPEIQGLLKNASEGLAGGPNVIPSSVSTAFAPAYSQLNTTINSAEGQAGGVIGQQAKQAGAVPGPNTVTDATSLAVRSLEQSRGAGTKALKYSEATAGLDNYNSLLSLLLGGSGTAIGMGGGAQGLANQATSMMSDQSQLGGALGGAAAGASVGSMFGPGYGTLIGGVAGGLYGALAGG